MLERDQDQQRALSALGAQGLLQEQAHKGQNTGLLCICAEYLSNNCSLLVSLFLLFVLIFEVHAYRNIWLLFVIKKKEYMTHFNMNNGLIARLMGRGECCHHQTEEDQQTW
jgi:hypothetical protein